MTDTKRQFKPGDKVLVYCGVNKYWTGRVLLIATDGHDEQAFVWIKRDRPRFFATTDTEWIHVSYVYFRE